MNNNSKEATEFEPEIEEPSSDPGFSTDEELSAFELFRQDLNNSDLLTYEEEIALSRRVKAAHEAKQILAGDGITIDQCNFYTQIAEDGRTALAVLCEANKRYIHSCVKKFSFNYHFENDENLILELNQEGKLAILEQAHLFDPNLGNRFLTYLGWWIRRYIQLAYHHYNAAIRTPVPNYHYDLPVAQTIGDLRKQLQREPTENELISYTAALSAAGQISFTSQTMLGYLSRRPVEIFSTDEPLDHFDPDSATLIEVLPATEPSIEKQIIRRDLLARVKAAIDTGIATEKLTVEQIEILRRRFFLDETLIEIGQAIGLSEYQVRRREASALKTIQTAVESEGEI